MNEEFDKVRNALQDLLQKLERNIEFSQTFGCGTEIIEKLNDLKRLVIEATSAFANLHPRINFLSLFQSIIANLSQSLPLSLAATEADIAKLPSATRLEYSKRLAEVNLLINFPEQLRFTLDFFSKLNFFDGNVVAVGANGSGKTRLHTLLKGHLLNNGVIISAQKILLFPEQTSFYTTKTTSPALKQIQASDKVIRDSSDLSRMGNELGTVVRNLISDHAESSIKYRQASVLESNLCRTISSPESTKLERVLNIWNNLIEHRRLRVIPDDFGIEVQTLTGDFYKLSEMSDGEKVTFFFIAQVLQAPQNGFVIVDEPEMYLHKAILRRLWDTLESERNDCLFIYLTHDLEFAVSRRTAKIVWIKSFTYPNKWEIEEIPKNEIPEALLLELLGSRRNILFCEGEKGKIDEQIYSVLFPEFTVMPVGSCFEVLNYTKAFNKFPVSDTKAKGLVDADLHPEERLLKLLEYGVFYLRVAEAENLFFDADFLELAAKQFLVENPEKTVETIKDEVIKHLSEHKEGQAAKYVSSKIEYHFKGSHVSEGSSLLEVSSNFTDFVGKIEVENWFDVRIQEIEQIVATKDYIKAVSIFNDKGLRRFPNKHIVKDFHDKCLRLLQDNPKAQELLRKYFPPELTAT